MATRERLICNSADVIERGLGARFAMPHLGDRETGFVVRYHGAVYGYINQCAHVPAPLDWKEGDFFDITRTSIICATHGAQYHPATGYCVLGPCKGKSLKKLSVVERDEKIYLIE
jgi:nitrite reductase/ring-hydroxylating ferredoxin subunit